MQTAPRALGFQPSHASRCRCQGVERTIARRCGSCASSGACGIDGFAKRVCRMDRVDRRTGPGVDRCAGDASGAVQRVAAPQMEAALPLVLPQDGHRGHVGGVRRGGRGDVGVCLRQLQLRADPLFQSNGAFADRGVPRRHRVQHLPRDRTPVDCDTRRGQNAGLLSPRTSARGATRIRSTPCETAVFNPSIISMATLRCR